MSTAVNEKVNEGKGVVMLPCGPDDFKDFISGILGKPQTIERQIPGPFTVNRDNIRDLYHLIEQRVLSQNEGALMQFTSRIVYDDNSSVLLNSIDDFLNYNEVKPLTSRTVVLNWVFLLTFRNRKAPEKQSIDVTFSSEIGYSFSHKFGPITESVIDLLANGMSVRISHTDRTWGSDIDSLLLGALERLTAEKSKIRESVNNCSGWIGAAAFLTCMSLSIWGVIESAHRIEQWHNEKLSVLGNNPTELMLLNYVSDSISEGAWTRFGLYGAFFVIFALISSIALGITAGTFAGKRQSSFVLLTEQARVKFEKSKTSLRNNWFKLFATALGSGFVGAFGKYLFVWLTRF